MSQFDESGALGDSSVAIIGMAGRFPGAKNLEEFWRNLRDGVESISRFSEQELRNAGVPQSFWQNPDYVPARAVVDEIEMFDPSFFGLSPREGAVMDPQHRLLLECAWEALERAGYGGTAPDSAIAVYAGASTNTYLFSCYSYVDLLHAFNDFQTIISNDKDFLTTRISYHLNLRGPSINVQTACSTSLVAVHLACQGLLTGECDMALAGGVSIKIPQTSGYIYQEGNILSSDGHCRAFDAKASGTVSGNGVGLVVLKRLSKAIEDRDCIHAVIRGSAINNDGAMKIGFTAPGMNGQTAAITEAMLIAGVEPRDVSYIETHGTGTPLGDPIEIAALTEVFRASVDENNVCAIGSVKTNIGHLDVAAGVAGLIKTVLAMQHAQIPPSLNFDQPNPKIDFQRSPFFVNSGLSEWKTQGVPRRAGVSSFGIGGTNAHVVLEEAPSFDHSTDDETQSGRWHLLPVSARTSAALETSTTNLAVWLNQHPDTSIGDVAFTLQTGRRAFSHRRMLLCRDRNEAIEAIERKRPERNLMQVASTSERPVAFMFPGQGAQYPNMARELYEHEPVFRAVMDECAEELRSDLGLDLREVIYPGPDDRASDPLTDTCIAQPALFAVEYSLARLWLEWGVQPRVMIGHSLGELTAACLAGVLSLRDGLTLAAVRGQLMQAMPEGGMLSIPLPAQDVRPMLGDRLALAAVNGPSLCVVSGEKDAIAGLELTLKGREIDCQKLRTKWGFHSAMMDPVLGPLAAAVAKLDLKPPRIPFISGLTGTWIQAAEATSPHYWTRQLRETVRFATGIRELSKDKDLLLVEVGPGRTLTTLARMQIEGASERILLVSLGMLKSEGSEMESMAHVFGRLWLSGAAVNWSGLDRSPRRRVELPTYPFERQRCWIDARQSVADEPQWRTTSESPNVGIHPRPALANAYVAPRSDLERALAEVWQNLLGHEAVGVYDNFFDLGGHSLMVTQLVARVREVFDASLSPQQIFQAANIADLAHLIECQILEEVETMSEQQAELLWSEQATESQKNGI